MKNLIVYYSWIGNTEVVAREIHNAAGGDIVKIEEVKQRKPGIGFGAAAFSAILGMKSRLKTMDFSLDGYDNIFLGAQVWASRTTPAINTFLNKADLKNKKVYLFITMADHKIPQKVIDSITRRVENKGGVVIDSLSITTKADTVIPQEAVREPVANWLRNIAASK